MPHYEYECEVCGQIIEEFHAHPDKAPARVTCLRCADDGGKQKFKTAVRCIGPGSGAIFRGPGFYATDYRKSPPTEPAQ